VTERAFGRLVAPDERDKNYPMRLMLERARDQFFPKGVPPGSRHYRPSPRILDQGNTGTCVAHGVTSYIEAPPFMQRLPLAPYDFYRKIVGMDEFPENDFEASAPDLALQSGTSVRAGLEAARSLGFIANYLWAESPEDARAWLLMFSGLVAGTTWKSGMMSTDIDGFVSYDGQDEGGHCFYIGGVNDHVRHNGKIVRAVRGQQSWGDWGQGGRFWIELDDLGKMLQDGGEFAAPTEIRVLPLAPKL
jgi:hypothetical protein